ncbi:MAG: tRNA pseudouridine(38-40) synthase TruA [Xanthomonadaceae bacterium]|nr:tRNA pseudouridine(38-40) synthase TruA [Xanthomonadaceae bacterium]
MVSSDRNCAIEPAAELPAEAGTIRYAAVLEYDGTKFAGWQRQQHAVTIQQAVEEALAAVAAHPIEVVCAGRTDAGVHAVHQVIHFDSTAVRSSTAWIRGANSHLPGSIRLWWAEPVAPDFHARFKALSRRYRYIIASRPVLPALYRDRVAWTYKPLDAERMHQAGQALVGEHDFSSFRAAECQAKHARREIYSLSVQRRGDLLYLDVEANAFLHHMVRNIAGVLMAVGSGEQPVQWAAEVLAARDRRLAGVTAPPQGLYLVGVRYPAHYGLPEPGAGPVFS